MIENFINAPWGQWIVLLSKGNPPLALQFLLINGVFFLIFAFRRLRGIRTRHANTAYVIHGILIMVNTAILYQDQLYPYYRYNILGFIHKVQAVI